MKLTGHILSMHLSLSYLQATRDVAAGELLIKEKPYAAIILKEEENSHCHHCFEQCSPIP